MAQQSPLGQGLFFYIQILVKRWIESGSKRLSMLHNHTQKHHTQ